MINTNEKEKKKAAIITGASSGIGLEIGRTLCRMGYEVYGLGRNFDGIDTAGDDLAAELEFDMEEGEDKSFHSIVCDVSDTGLLCRMIKDIQKKADVHVLVNNAGAAYYGLHEELNAKKIKEMVRTNIEVPMILTQLLMRELKRTHGYIINISSVTASQTNPHGAAYGATKAALTSFSRSIFEEARKYGVKVTTIAPDMTQTNLYRNADFSTDDGEQRAYLLPGEVAEAVEYVLDRREGMVVSEMTLRPQLHRIKRKQPEEARPQRGQYGTWGRRGGNPTGY